MSEVEREIIEKFHQLQPAAKQRIRALIDQEVDTQEFDYVAWSHDIEALRQQISDNRKNSHSPIDVVGMLRDIRDGEDE